MTKPSKICQQHVAIEVSDVEKSIDFYRKVLGMKLTERHAAGEVQAIKVELVFLRISDHHHDLNLVHLPGKDYKRKNAQASEVNFHHMAFEYPNRAAWLKQLEHVQACGVTILRGPVLHSPYQPGGEGSWCESESFYYEDPDGHRIENFWHMARIDEDGRFRYPDTGELVDENARADEV
jgi:catechol 2,3-dioxygenase-like lactoylglutathione lyase family enzyme